MSNAQPQVTSNVTEERAKLLAQIEELKALNASLYRQERATFRLNVSEKGAVSMYGMGRFPVTLYKEQWQNLFAHIEDIKAFIAANDSKLKTKPTKV